MSGVSTLAKFHLNDMLAEYLVDQSSQAVGLRIYPAVLEAQVAAHREKLGQPDIPAWSVEPLVQFKLLGDPTDEYTQGVTMRNSASLASLRLEDQQVISEGDQTVIITRLASPRGYAGEHHLSWRRGDQAVTIQTIFYNRSDKPLTLEMLASFSLSGITPFAVNDAPGRLYIHRFRSNWSAEGRHERRLAEDMGLEPSWAHHGVRVERFGQVGSMPVRGFFPWAGVEDHAAGVMWGAQLAIPGSWQMEFFRRDDFLCFSGGLADRELGHWMKTVAPGEQFATPLAYVSTVQGDLDDLCARLVNMQLPAAEAAPASESDLPVICNEWCTSWGNPRHEDLIAMADKLQGSGVKYLVIDAGWYKGDEGVWYLGQGDWVANPHLFPYGLAATAKAIRERGLIPGIWFEMEVVGEQSPRFAQDIRHFLHRDGFPITATGRRFWDFRDPWVIDYLSQKVIGQLRDSGLGYIKVDYNETIGLGCDQADSPGEGLRQHLESVQGFFRKMRAELPDLVIENCASGGHRLEPSFMGLTSMASFSDAHETRDIPVIAANLHRLILPRQSQIWAVLHAGDSMDRLVYLLTGGFLGRLCISGEISSLDPEQWALVIEGIQFYQQVAPLIARGKSRLFQSVSPSWQHLQGAQAVLRLAEDEHSALVVTHSFAAPLPAELRVPLPGMLPGSIPGKGWQVARCFPQSGPAPVIMEDQLRYVPSKEWQGAGIYLAR
jgi:alpha-galactosidase